MAEETGHLLGMMADGHKEARRGRNPLLDTVRGVRVRLRSAGEKVQKEEIFELQRFVDGKKSSLRKTYKTQSEANDKVCQLSENTEKALALPAKIFEHFEVCNRDGEFDQVEILLKAAADALEEADRAAKRS